MSSDECRVASGQWLETLLGLLELLGFVEFIELLGFVEFIELLGFIEFFEFLEFEFMNPLIS